MDIHDNFAQSEESLRRKMLCEEVSQIVVGTDKGNANGVVFDCFANEKVAALDMFGTIVMLRIIGQIAGRGVVAGQSKWTGSRRIDFITKFLKIDAVFGGFSECDDLGFGAGECDAALLFRTRNGR